MAPGVIRGKAEGIDEFVFCRVELAEFVENHGEVATGVGQNVIGERLCRIRERRGARL
jgi:hypothetical protein